jgi:prepilin-type processing-associated H-X9-DG protein
LRQFGLAAQMYTNSYKGWCLPGYYGGPFSSEDDNTPFNRCWLRPYDVRKALSLPLMNPFLSNGNPNGNQCYVPFDKKWYCPDALRGAQMVYQPDIQMWVVPINYSYGMNVTDVDFNPAGSPCLDLTLAPYANPTLIAGAVHGYKQSKVKHPAEKLMFADALWNVINIWGSGISPGWNGKISSYDILHEANFAGGAWDSRRTIAWRHQGGANVCFFDGHVDWLRKDQIYNKDQAGNITGNDKLWRPLKD